jgi:hypothetical protein
MLGGPPKKGLCLLVLWMGVWVCGCLGGCVGVWLWDGWVGGGLAVWLGGVELKNIRAVTKITTRSKFAASSISCDIAKHAPGKLGACSTTGAISHDWRCVIATISQCTPTKNTCPPGTQWAYSSLCHTHTNCYVIAALKLRSRISAILPLFRSDNVAITRKIREFVEPITGGCGRWVTLKKCWGPLDFKRRWPVDSYIAG